MMKRKHLSYRFTLFTFFDLQFTVSGLRCTFSYTYLIVFFPRFIVEFKTVQTISRFERRLKYIFVRITAGLQTTEKTLFRLSKSQYRCRKNTHDLALCDRRYVNMFYFCFATMQPKFIWKTARMQIQRVFCLSTRLPLYYFNLFSLSQKPIFHDTPQKPQVHYCVFLWPRSIVRNTSYNVRV